MEADRIRRTFRDFFQERGHQPVASAPLVAPGDPTLLFTSAGMVPFKPYFLGQATPPRPRLTSTQKCFRTTDIDEVGDESHLTFFEMMGNFSLGDYFKAEAQAWAWELVTQVVGVPADRLVTTVFLDDDVAHENWRKIGVPPDRIYRYGEDQGNYWFSGLNGPCGPCSEIHYDLRPDGSHPGPAADEDRYLEIWNLVFMQFLQGADGSRTPLPRQNIDTGAGLERWAMMLQDTPTLYETDVFAPLLAYVAERCARDYATAPAAEQSALRVVVEHGRSMTFLVSDGVLPSNEGRGYVLRRLIRRALYMAHTLGIQEPLLVDVAAQVRGHMGDAYPEVRDQAALVDNVLGAGGAALPPHAGDGPHPVGGADDPAQAHFRGGLGAVPQARAGHRRTPRRHRDRVARRACRRAAPLPGPAQPPARRGLGQGGPGARRATREPGRGPHR